jgi:hypothetical protein
MSYTKPRATRKPLRAVMLEAKPSCLACSDTEINPD